MSITIKKYKVRCTTDNKDEFWFLPEDDPVPTTCPANSAHSINGGATTVEGTISEKLQDQRMVLSANGVKLNAFGFKFTATKSVKTTHDHLLSDTFRLRGGILEADKNVFGDLISLSIVDVDNILGYGAGFVVASYFSNWNMPKAGYYEILEVSLGDPIPPGLYIRVEYDSVGSTDDVEVGINFRAYKDP